MHLCQSPSLYDRADFGRFFRGRSGSCGFVDYKPEVVEERARRLVSEDSATSNSSFSFSVEVGLSKNFRLSKYSDLPRFQNLFFKLKNYLSFVAAAPVTDCCAGWRPRVPVGRAGQPQQQRHLCRQRAGAGRGRSQAAHSHGDQRGGGPSLSFNTSINDMASGARFSTLLLNIYVQHYCYTWALSVGCGGPRQAAGEVRPASVAAELRGGGGEEA